MDEPPGLAEPDRRRSGWRSRAGRRSARAPPDRCESAAHRDATERGRETPCERRHRSRVSCLPSSRLRERTCHSPNHDGLPLLQRDHLLRRDSRPMVHHPSTGCWHSGTRGPRSRFRRFPGHYRPEASHGDSPDGAVAWRRTIRVAATPPSHGAHHLASSSPCPSTM